MKRVDFIALGCCPRRLLEEAPVMIAENHTYSFSFVS